MSCFHCGRDSHPELLGVPLDLRTMIATCWMYENHTVLRERWGGAPHPAEVKIDKDTLMVVMPKGSKHYYGEGIKTPEHQPHPQQVVVTAVELRKPIEEGPSWFKMAVNFTKASVKHVWHGLPETPTEIEKERIETCLACPLLRPDTGKCRKCGCASARKASWAMEKCPEGKWKR